MSRIVGTGLLARGQGPAERGIMTAATQTEEYIAEINISMNNSINQQDSRSTGER
jgi:hypothetical protein